MMRGAISICLGTKMYRLHLQVDKVPPALSSLPPQAAQSRAKRSAAAAATAGAANAAGGLPAADAAAAAAAGVGGSSVRLVLTPTSLLERNEATFEVLQRRPLTHIAALIRSVTTRLLHAC